MVVEKGYEEYLFDELGYTNGIVKIDIVENVVKQPLKFNLAKQTFDLIPEIDSIYFSGEHPLIYFKSITDFNDEIIKNLHKKIWNQGRVPLLFITSPTEIRIYNCYKPPLKENISNTQSLEIDRFANSVQELAKIKASYHQSQIDSGIFWETSSGKKISTAQKVDQLLVRNLKETRKKLLLTYPNEKGNALAYIHNLLGRSLFILYLQDRGIITSEYFAKFLDNAIDYFSILSDKDACYELFKELNSRFNGDLFTVTNDEQKDTNIAHLEVVRKCFYGDDVKSGQLTIWRMYDFSFIPIELISSIYEEFLHTEEGEVAISSQGAYYTPQPLVEFVLNEVLPYPDESNTNWELKILDPACGSGVFLVEAYRRLIERWKYVHKNEKLSIDILKEILGKSIYGVEQNSEAIKVASFSLYLSILNYLEPKSIWANENVKFPHLINSKERKDEDQGYNLFEGDTFEVEGYLGIQYNLVIGNPPWKRGNLSNNMNAYIKKYDLGNEAVLPFLHKMAHIAPDAKIALVSTAKILFNSTSGYENFRKFLFAETKVDAIINFSSLRKSKGEIGRKLFASASGPTIVIIYCGINTKTRNESIVYCVPKPNYRDSALSELIIDASDIKFIPISEAMNPKSNIWKVAMWGTIRDYQLIKKYSKGNSLLNILNSDAIKWFHGGGFRTTNPKKYKTDLIKSLPYLAAKKIEQFYTPIGNCAKIEDVEFERLGETNTYNAPHIVIKEGQSKKRFCASFLDYSCTFKSNTYGITSNVDTKILKGITAYLNSTFATYYLFLSLSRWGIERERVEFNQMLDIPAFDFLFNTNSYSKIAIILDKIIDEKKKFALNPESEIASFEKEIDEFLFKEIGFTKNELCLIHNVVESNLDFFQEGAKSQAILPTQRSEIEKYAKMACSNMANILTDAKTFFWAKTYNVNVKSPLTILSFHFNKENKNSTVLYDDESNVSEILGELNKLIYQKHSESIYFRKVVKHYDDDVLFMVKPNEKRFWTEAVALDDSDNISIEMIAQDRIL